MSEGDIVLRWLGDAARRIRLNERLEDASRLSIGLLVLAIVYQLLMVTVSVQQLMRALLPLVILAAASVIVVFAWRLFGRDLLGAPDRARAAAVADGRARLNNELSSALWFSSSAPADHFVRLHLARAAQTVQRLELARLLPLAVPRSLPVAVTLALALLLIWLVPHVDVVTNETGSVRSVAPRAVAIGATGGGADEPFDNEEFVAERGEAAWLKIEKLARELRSGPETAEIAEAIAARDATTASRLLARMRPGEAAQPASGPAARPETEQMSQQLAAGIVERLQSLLNQGGWSTQAGGDADSGRDMERLTDDLTRELREEIDQSQSGQPGEMSPEEQTLNTTLQAMSRDSSGGREVIRGEANPMQGLGRTSVGSGAMGRRIGVSTGGAGEGDQPHGNPQGSAEAEPVLGQKTLRLQLKMQTVTIDSPDSDNSDGNEESFYAATQAQAARAAYQDIVAKQLAGAEQSTTADELPIEYREAVKEYAVRQHRRERSAAQ